MKRPFVMGNWKLNGDKKMIKIFMKNLRKNLIDHIYKCTVSIAPPVVYLDLANHCLSGSKIELGAQNIDIHLSGSFTGEISAKMLKDVGAKYIIIGHSERRIYHKENNEDICKKFSLLKDVGLIPVLCIGETEEEYKKNQTEIICANQLDIIINNLGSDAFENTVIAYEPIWAIGTGKSANSLQVQVIHNFIRNYISSSSNDKTLKEKIIILYGGSVNTKNSMEFFTKMDIDGALVGGSSLDVDTFSDIIKFAIEAKNL